MMRNLAHGAFYTWRLRIGRDHEISEFGPAVVLSRSRSRYSASCRLNDSSAGVSTRRPDPQPARDLRPRAGRERAIRIVWECGTLSASIPPFRGSVIVGDFLFSRYRLLILAVVAVVLCRVWLLLHKTSFGRVVRAGQLTRHGHGARYPAAALYDRHRHARRRHGRAGRLFAPISIVHPAMGARNHHGHAFVVVVIGSLGSFWGVVMRRSWSMLSSRASPFAPAAGEASIYL